MATTLTFTKVNRPSRDVTALATAADGTGNNWLGTGLEFLIIVNGSGSSVTMTVGWGVGGVVDGVSPASETVVVIAAHTAICGPWPPTLFNDVNGKVNVTWSAVTSVTVLLMQPGT